ncbi:cupin domain-containing protein [Roseibium sp. MMSF_3544]|uniref:cupin domain-containing protein n=1 Tax=unclassified Roseibium TaxID=2629323 RepID=UPI0027401169|nr:cupin domain-containing protein [Roseibium sp. MMSF_3544]
MKLVRNEDVSWIEGEGYRKKILLRGQDVNQDGGLVQLVEIAPHTEVKAHYHKSCTEVFHVLSGKGAFTIDGERIDLAPGQTLTCEPLEVHSTENPFDLPFTYIVFKTNAVENDLFWCDRLATDS